MKHNAPADSRVFSPRLPCLWAPALQDTSRKRWVDHPRQSLKTAGYPVHHAYSCGKAPAACQAPYRVRTQPGPVKCGAKAHHLRIVAGPPSRRRGVRVQHVTRPAKHGIVERGKMRRSGFVRRGRAIRLGASKIRKDSSTMCGGCCAFLEGCMPAFPPGTGPCAVHRNAWKVRDDLCSISGICWILLDRPCRLPLLLLEAATGCGGVQAQGGSRRRDRNGG